MSGSQGTCAAVDDTRVGAEWMALLQKVNR